MMSTTESPHMKARYDHAPTGSPHHHRRRVSDAAYLVAQLRLDYLQFISIEIAGKLEVVHVGLVIDPVARGRGPTCSQPPSRHPTGLLNQTRHRRSG